MVELAASADRVRAVRPARLGVQGGPAHLARHAAIVLVADRHGAMRPRSLWRGCWPATSGCC